jgi:hypothetical protein
MEDCLKSLHICAARAFSRPRPKHRRPLRGEITRAGSVVFDLTLKGYVTLKGYASLVAMNCV